MDYERRAREISVDWLSYENANLIDAIAAALREAVEEAETPVIEVGDGLKVGQRTVREWHAELARLLEENRVLRELVADVVEDETEFETEWNKAARAALDGKEK